LNSLYSSPGDVEVTYELKDRFFVFSLRERNEQCLLSVNHIDDPEYLLAGEYFCAENANIHAEDFEISEPQKLIFKKIGGEIEVIG
jgi:hypothetical protein